MKLLLFCLIPALILGAKPICGEDSFLADINQAQALDAIGPDGQTLLLRAIAHGYPEAVRVLLNKGADVNKADATGMTPLMAAAFKDQPEIYSQIIHHHPDIHARRKNGWTALMALAWRGSQAEAEELAFKGANLDEKNDEQETAYIKARQRGFSTLADMLLAHGAAAGSIFVPASPYATDTMIPGRRWALALAAMTSLRNGNSTNRLGGAPPELRAELAQLFQAWWKVRNRDQAIEVLHSLDAKGQRAQYEGYRLLFLEHPRWEAEDLGRELKLDQEDLVQARFVKRSMDRLGGRGILAWDLGRIVIVADIAYASGYLSEDEAWDWIMGAAKRVQSAFISWKDYSDNYLEGRKFSGLDEDARLYAVQELLLDSKAGGPWNQLQWKTPLESSAKADGAVKENRVPPYPKEAVENLREEAREGCRWAKFELARRYQSGDLVLGVGDESLRYYMADAALTGYPWALVAMGRFYWKPNTMRQSLDYYEKAANAGMQEGMTFLASAYLRGDNRKKDLKRSYELFDQASKDGEPGTWTMLGDFFHNGYGRAVDFAKSAELYEKAAASGEPRAAMQLADQLVRGEGVPQNLEKAAYWLDRAILRHEPGAEAKLQALKTTAPLPRSRPGVEVLQAGGTYQFNAEPGSFKWVPDLAKAFREKGLLKKGPYTPFGCRLGQPAERGCPGRWDLGGDYLLVTDGKRIMINTHIVQGREPDNSFVGKALIQGDCIHLWFREKPELSDRSSGGAYTRLDHHMVVAPSNSLGGGQAWSEDGVHNRAKVITVPRPDGYLLTVLIPASDLGLAGLKKGDRLRFDIGATANSKNQEPQRVRWHGKDHGQEDPDTWGMVELK